MENEAAPKRAPLNWRAILKEFKARFEQYEYPMRASALAFTLVFSLIPLALLGLALLGFLIPQPEQVTESLVRFLAQLAPGAIAESALRDILKQLQLEKTARGLMQGSAWAVALGVASQLWTGVSFFVSATTPLNRAWKVKETRSYLRLYRVGGSVFAGTTALFLLSLLPSAGPGLLRHLPISWLQFPAHPPFWVDALFGLFAIALDIAMFVLMYQMLPNAKVPWRVALAGGAITGIFWEAFKRALALYLSRFGDYNKLYGAFGGLAFLVTWIWYSCTLLLAGGILCKMFEEHWHQGGVALNASAPPEPPPKETTRS